ncbi:MAG: adenylate/guanylate cyclase domain-containing protein [Betaproteobacteria bacterium]
MAGRSMTTIPHDPARGAGRVRGGSRATTEVENRAGATVESGADAAVESRAGATVESRASLACDRIHAQLNHGAPWDACDSFRETIAADPDDAELLYCGALAHARVGATEHAHQLLDQVLRASPPAAMIPAILSLRGRLWKDRMQRATDAAAITVAATRARDEYRAAHALSQGVYPGVNAATLSMLLGDHEEARALARRILAQLDAQFAAQPTSITCWDHASRGEAELLLGHVEAAMRSYAAARALAPGDAGVVATMRRQVALLERVIPGAARVLPSIPAADVLAFVGHMIDAPANGEPRFPPVLVPAVDAAIRARLAGFNHPIAYTSAACGADLIFIEAALERGAEVNIVLPFDGEDFARTSVAIGGDGWRERFERALRQATRVIMATEEGHLGDDVLYEYAATLLEGLAMLRASQLHATPLLLAVIDAASEERIGGTRASFERWRRNAGMLEVIDLRELRDVRKESTSARRSRPRATRPARMESARIQSTRIQSAPVGAPPPDPAAIAKPPQARPARELKTMLFADFAGYSRLHDAFAPLFQQRFLEIGAQQVAASATRPLEVKTWGDAMYCVFSAPREGAEFALGLLARMLEVDWTATGLPDTSQIRIALHAGPVFHAFDPIMDRYSYFGSNVTRAARIEPITPPGMIYVSEAFAGTLVASGERDYALEYIGMLPLAKSYGASRIYRLDRR